MVIDECLGYEKYNTINEQRTLFIITFSVFPNSNKTDIKSFSMTNLLMYTIKAFEIVAELQTK